MIRALYISASGMKAQQGSMDTISNNMSNVNTTGFKKSRPAFKDAMYTAMERRTGVEEVNLHQGSGVHIGAVLRSFVGGSLINTGNTLDLAIDGPGFFAVQGPNDIFYTRDGGFTLSAEGDINKLTTADGLYVLDSNYQSIELSGEMEGLEISPDGWLTIRDAAGNLISQTRLGMYGFANPNGLEAAGNNLFRATESSGAWDRPGGYIKQGFLEGSNVQTMEEMTNMILAQRAYQMNSRVLQTADEMERLANNLRG